MHLRCRRLRSWIRHIESRHVSPRQQPAADLPYVRRRYHLSPIAIDPTVASRTVPSLALTVSKETWTPLRKRRPNVLSTEYCDQGVNQRCESKPVKLRHLSMSYVHDNLHRPLSSPILDQRRYVLCQPPRHQFKTLNLVRFGQCFAQSPTIQPAQTLSTCRTNQRIRLLHQTSGQHNTALDNSASPTFGVDPPTPAQRMCPCDCITWLSA